MCDIDFGGDESASAWSVQQIKHARKEHRCDSCGTTIKVGRPYVRMSWVQEGTADTEKCCLVCWRIGERFGKGHGWTPLPSNITDVLNECIDYGDEDSKRWRRDLHKIHSRRSRARELARAAA